MNCPYLDCDQDAVPAGAPACPKCRRALRACINKDCGGPNRAFSAHCRACGKLLPEPRWDWIGFRAGPEARAVNEYEVEHRNSSYLEEIRTLELGDRCKTLLSYDGYLIAIAANGLILLADPLTDGETRRWTMEGRAFGEPCVSRGTLYVGGQGFIAAYTLAHALAGRIPEPRWTVKVPGTPIFSLLAAGGCLYAVVGLSNTQRRVVVLDDRNVAEAPTLTTLFTGSKVSYLAGGSGSASAVSFLTESGGKIYLNRSRPAAGQIRLQTTEVTAVPRPLKDHIPIATVGKNVYAVLGEEHKLCRIEAKTSRFSQLVETDTNAFALDGLRDGVVLQTDGLRFLGSNSKERLNPNERTVGSPVVIRGRLGLVGMRDGRIRWYHLDNTALFGESRLAKDSEGVSALISFYDLVVAGNRNGRVRVFRVMESAAT